MGLLSKYGVSSAAAGTPGVNLDNSFVKVGPIVTSSNISTGLMTASITSTQPYTKLLIWFACNVGIEVTGAGTKAAIFDITANAVHLRQITVYAPDAGPLVYAGFVEVHNTGEPAGGSFDVEVSWNVPEDSIVTATAEWATLLVVAVEGPVP